MYRKIFILNCNSKVFLYLCSWIRPDNGAQPEPKLVAWKMKILILLCVAWLALNKYMLTIRPKAKWSFRTAAMLLCFYKNTALTKVIYFSVSIVIHNFSTLALEIAFTSQVCASTILSLLVIVGNRKLRQWGGICWHALRTEFREN